MASKETKNLIKSNWVPLMDEEAISHAISRIALQIIEKHPDLRHVTFVGIRTCGAFFAERLQKSVAELSGIELPIGAIDISLYRDDYGTPSDNPRIKATEIPFSITDATIILCDDIFFTGRTIRAALDALIDLGRPGMVELAILIDRGHKEFPIKPDYVGRVVESTRDSMVKVRLKEQGEGIVDSVYIIPSN